MRVVQNKEILMNKLFLPLLSLLFVAAFTLVAAYTPKSGAPIAATEYTAEELAEVTPETEEDSDDGDDFNDNEEEDVEGSAETAHFGRRKNSGYGMYKGGSGYSS